jgi:hypothetical protein
MTQMKTADGAEGGAKDEVDASDLGWLLGVGATTEGASTGETELVRALREDSQSPSCRRSDRIRSAFGTRSAKKPRGSSTDHVELTSASNASTDYGSSPSSGSSSPSIRPEAAGSEVAVLRLYPERRKRPSSKPADASAEEPTGLSGLALSCDAVSGLVPLTDAPAVN